MLKKTLIIRLVSVTRMVLRLITLAISQVKMPHSLMISVNLSIFLLLILDYSKMRMEALN